MRSTNTYRLFWSIIVSIITTVLITSCSVTKPLESNQQLLVNNKIKIDNKKLDSEDMYNYLKQKPNRKTFGILFHHRVYNMYLHSERKIGSWIRETIGEGPVIYDSLAKEKSQKQLTFYMQEHGYYNAVVFCKEKKHFLNKQKVTITYKITTGKPYIIDSIAYNFPDTTILQLVKTQNISHAFGKNMIFDLEALKSVRKRIATIAQDNGYYSITENDIYFAADTTKGNNSVELTIGLKPSKYANRQYKKFRINKIVVYPNTTNKLNKTHKDYTLITEYNTDSTVTYVYENQVYVKPSVIDHANYIKNDDFYNLSLVKRTQRQLQKNRLFKIVNITFTEVPIKDSLYNYVDCQISLSPSTQQSITFEVEGTNTAGDWGSELNISYTNKNLNKGAENLNIRTLVAGEYNNALKTPNEHFKLFNTYEYGLETKLEIPKFFSPIKPEKFDYKYRPVTNFKAAYNFMKTPDYTRPTAHFSYGYTWFGNNYLTHYFNPIEVSYIYYYNPSERFEKFINSRDYYRYSYEDYMIYNFNYGFTFYNKSPNADRDYKFYRLYIESAGSLLQLAGKTLNWEQDSGRYSTFNVPFAQYIKLEGDYRYYKVFDKKKCFVSRIFGGIAVPYLNSEAVPSVKKYYAGGANSMRAWSSRTLGPGSLVDTSGGLKYYLGDIKLEANLEARFDMFWIIEGAAFLDIGNIWSYNNEGLDGSKFSLNTFWDEMAVDVGYGFRFDFSFFIFRTDIGVKLREPVSIKGTNSHIIWGNRKLTNTDFNLNIGIGYPF